MGYQTVSLKEIFIFTIEVFCVTLRASLGVLVVKSWSGSAGDTRDSGSILGSGRFPGGGHGNPLQYSFFLFFLILFEYSMDREAW